MEGIVFDLKPRLNLEKTGLKKAELLKSKDFSCTMESTIEKNKEMGKKENTQKNVIDKETFTKEEKKEIKTEETKEVEAESVEEEKTEIVYENILNVLNVLNVKVNEENLVETSNDPMEEIVSTIETIGLVEEELKFEDLEERFIEENIASNSEVKTDNNLETNIRTKSDDTKESIISTIVNEEPKEDKIKQGQNNRDLTLNEDENLQQSMENTKQIVETSGENQLDGESQNNTSGKKQYSTEISIESNEDTKQDSKVEDNHFVGIKKEEVIFQDRLENTTEETDTIDKKQVIDQIVDKMKFDFSNDKNQIRIKLKPEILGDMTMNLEVAKGAITAKIMVDNLRTKEIIEANLIQLKEEIKDKGMEIKTFEVFVGNDADFDKHSSSQFSFNHNNKRLKLNNKNNKFAVNYEENQVQNTKDRTDIYSENSLNLMA